MKQIFDWLREQMQSKANLYRECPSEACWIRTSRDCEKCDLKSLEVREIFDLINEAEAKWESDCCEWTFMEGVEDCRCGCNGYHVDYMVATKYNFCPYCGKPIKISEV